MNFLESLVAEWYEYREYFVRSNVRTRERGKKGGYDVELDVLAFSPKDQSLVHIETSSDANSWRERKERFLKKKFILTHDEYEDLVLKSKIKTIKKIAIVGWNYKTKSDLNWRDDIEVKLIPNLLEEITAKLKKTSPSKHVVPENYPLLRTIQIMIEFQKRSTPV